MKGTMKKPVIINLFVATILLYRGTVEKTKCKVTCELVCDYYERDSGENCKCKVT